MPTHAACCAILGCFLLLTGCGKPSNESAEPGETEEKRAPSEPAPDRCFTDCTRSALESDPVYRNQVRRGISHWLERQHRQLATDLDGLGGMATGDVNGDGLLDLFLCECRGVPNALLLQNPDGTFSNVAGEWQVDWLEDARSALLVDLDNDGDSDLALAAPGAVVLAANEGDKFAIRTTLPCGLDVTHLSAADYDLDGWLDLYLSTCRVSKTREIENPVWPIGAHQGGANSLYRNEKNFAFSDVTHSTGLDVDNREGTLSSIWIDYDQDGDSDLYIVNDFAGHRLFRNDEGPGNKTRVFTQFSDTAGIPTAAETGDNKTAAWMDGDGDGRPDLFRQNRLLQNNGEGGFEATSEIGGTWARAATAVDLNNDGREDLVTGNGNLTGRNRSEELSDFFVTRVLAAPDDAAGLSEFNRRLNGGASWGGNRKNRLFFNEGDSLEDFSETSGFDFTLTDDTRAIAALDWDDDGDQDLFLRNRNAPRLRLLRNEKGQDQGAYLNLFLNGDGETANRDAIGARVEVILTGASRRLLKSKTADAASHPIHFGLGPPGDHPIEKVVIHWPTRGNQRQEIGGEDLEHNRSYRIVQGAGLSPSPPATRSALVIRPLPLEAPPSKTPPPDRIFCLSLYPFPGIGYLGLDGKETAYQGKPGRWSLVHLTDLSRKPCREQLEDMSELSARFSEAGVDILALSVEAKGSANARILRALPFSVPPGYLDGKHLPALQETIDQLTALDRDLTFPVSLLTNPRQQIVAVYRGSVSPDSILKDMAASELSPHERLEHLFALGGRIIPDPEFHTETAIRESIYQFELGYEVSAASPVAGAICFGEALRHNPGFVEPRIHLGIALNRLKQFEAAQRHLELVVRMKPPSEQLSAAVFQLSEIALRENRQDEAMAYLETTLKHDPNHSIALNNLAFLLSTKNPVESEAFQRAFAMAVRAVELTESKQPNFLDTLASIHQRAGRIEEAMAALEKAISVEEKRSSFQAGILKTKLDRLIRIQSSR